MHYGMTVSALGDVDGRVKGRGSAVQQEGLAAKLCVNPSEANPTCANHNGRSPEVGRFGRR
jgi:hypothetical protein